MGIIESVQLIDNYEYDIEECKNYFSNISKKYFLKQNWLLDEDPDFEPAYIKLGYNGDKLLIFANMVDSDIFNPATKFNDPVRNQGDFFEIILRPDTQLHYYEMHVTPDNIQSQYCFPSENFLKEHIWGKGVDYIIENYGYNKRLFNSKTEIEKENNIWRVFAEVDLRAITNNYRADKDRQIYFAFCRYNYNRPSNEPQLSSTARLTEKNFHNQNEWDTLVIPANGE